MRRFVSAAVAAAILASFAAGSVLAAKPTIFKIDISDPAFEAGVEAQLLVTCGYPIELDGRGHIIVHVFDGPRVVEIDNFRLFETYSANGKSVTIRPDSGPDIYWVGRDGALYLALTGRSVTGSGVIGRTVVNLDTGEVVSSHGHEIGDFASFLCSELAPPAH